MKRIKQFAAVALAGFSALLIVGSTAQVTTPSNPTVDLSIGPVAVNAQAVNIALALSVEWPTVGSAYRAADYNHATTYLGYFDPKGCYTYKDTSTGAPLNGEYFFRNGSVDADGYCNTASSGTGYSGNALNYVTTSSIDLLRYALTGGNRVVDTASTTVLGRAYLYSAWNLNNSTHFPAKRIPAAMVGKVIPPLRNGDVYGGGCWDRVWFGTSNSSTPCDAPGSAGDLNPTVVTATVTSTVTNVVQVPRGSAAPTGGVFQTTTWVISNPLQTVTVAPVEGPVTFTDVTVLGSGTGTVAPPGYPTATTFLYNSYVDNGGTTTTAPVSPVPTTVVGSVTATQATRYFVFPSPPASGAYRTFTFNSTSINVCRTSNSSAPTGFKGSLTASGAPTSVANGACGSGAYSGYSSRGTVSNLSRTVYELWDVNPVYATYTLVPVYKDYTIRRDYHVYNAFDNYLVTSTVTGTTSITTTGVIYARVRVCDDSEKTTRTDLCERYPDGNYKPVGEIQRNASGVRVAAFGYLADGTTSRYGGVLRAPMKYPGPSYRDPDGVLQTNAAAEWDANNGVFVTDPLGASPTYATSGVVNYLNKFGTTGVQGYYKEFDPVGELYYEVLRYFQGLGPTAAATSGATAAMADGFPYYLTSGTGLARWQDPVQNSCERRNFILTIGDVNTHYDKQLPGHRYTGSSLETTVDATRAAEAIPGSSTLTFNAAAWTDLLTGFETGVSKSYNDALGRSQNTLGNPNPNANNTDLAIKATGSGGRSAYYWAGAAYWANTQPIRYDTKNGESMKDVRVKTFAIDVDEGGNGSIEDTNPRSIKPRRSSFYLAGKYGWFKDTNEDGNPFKTSGGQTNNTEWEDLTAPNTPDGYVIASQAQKMIDGIRKFFAAAASEKGAVSVSALSSKRFNSNAPNGDVFAPQFNTRDWSGTVLRSRLVYNTTTQSVEPLPNPVWDAGQILTAASIAGTATVPAAYVKPVDRKIFTMARDSGTMQGVIFDVANKSNLDAAVSAALNANPATAATDGLIDQRINWLRGDRSNEQSSTGGSLRRRLGILGDIINSGPVYKKEPNPDTQGAGYLAFNATVASRTATVYVGANDGMLHAFRASDGKELFAYMPRAVATEVNKLTNPNYIHRPYVDGVPHIDEVQVGSDWKTMLVSGMGGGAQGVFALDVTNPESFGASNVMFEFTDQDDADMGNIVFKPTLVKLKVPGATTSAPSTYRWFIAVGSGYNNYRADGRASSTAQQAMFFLSVDKGASDAWQQGVNYFKVVLPVGNSALAEGLSNPGVVTNDSGVTTLLYAGDLQGNVWKFDLSDGINTANVSNSVFTSGGIRRPLFVAQDSLGNRQPITTTPMPIAANAKGFVVTVGTGKFLEPSDAQTTAVQSIYGIWDSLETTATNFTVPRNKLFERTTTVGTSTTVISTTTFAYGFSTGEYRGWYINLPETRERVGVDGAVAVGSVAINSAIPQGSCSGDGDSRSYALNPVTGMSQTTIRRSGNIGIAGSPTVVVLDDNAYSTRDPRGFRTVTIGQQIVSLGTKITDGGTTGMSTARIASVQIPAGRINWRELRN